MCLQGFSSNVFVILQNQYLGKLSKRPKHEKLIFTGNTKGKISPTLKENI